MRLLADENLDSAIVDWLRAEGHDVMWVLETSRGIADPDVLASAEREGRVVVTNDLDFGQLVFVEGFRCEGVVILRLGSMGRRDAIDRFKVAWGVTAPAAPGNLVVIGETTIRVRPLQPPN